MLTSGKLSGCVSWGIGEDDTPLAPPVPQHPTGLHRWLTLITALDLFLKQATALSTLITSVGSCRFIKAVKVCVTCFPNRQPAANYLSLLSVSNSPSSLFVLSGLSKLDAVSYIGASGLYDMKKIREWATKSRLDPNDPKNTSIMQLLKVSV